MIFFLLNLFCQNQNMEKGNISGLVVKEYQDKAVGLKNIDSLSTLLSGLLESLQRLSQNTDEFTKHTLIHEFHCLTISSVLGMSIEQNQQNKDLCTRALETLKKYAPKEEASDEDRYYYEKLVAEYEDHLASASDVLGKLTECRDIYQSNAKDLSAFLAAHLFTSQQ